MTAFDLVVTPQGCRFGNRHFPCTVGRGGVTQAKREGDGATPAGRLRIVGLLYRPDRIARTALPLWALPIGPRDLWCDDPAHPDYNRMTRAPFGASHERLARGDPLYDLILLTDWNWPHPVPGRGSAIFVHTWRSAGYPTAGCIAFRRDHLVWIANHLRPDSAILIAGGALAGRHFRTAAAAGTENVTELGKSRWRGH